MGKMYMGKIGLSCRNLSYSLIDFVSWIWYNTYTIIDNHKKERNNMTDNELLLAISEIVEKKVKAEIAPLKADIQQIKDEQTRINLIIENEIRSDLQLLAE